MITYGAMIKVIAGFYIGCTGQVFDYEKVNGWEHYKVNLQCVVYDELVSLEKITLKKEEIEVFK